MHFAIRRKVGTYSVDLVLIGEASIQGGNATPISPSVWTTPGNYDINIHNI